MCVKVDGRIKKANTYKTSIKRTLCRFFTVLFYLIFFMFVSHTDAWFLMLSEVQLSLCEKKFYQGLLHNTQRKDVCGL